MKVPCTWGEHTYNCCEVAQDLVRTREEVYADEPHTGKSIVWRVLGFGGLPIPLLVASIAALAMRSVQCLVLDECTGEFTSQLCVGGPANTVVGSPYSSTYHILESVMLCLCVFGLPLA